MNTFVQADIREEGDKVRFRVTHAAPVPTVPFEVLTRPGNSLHSNYFECVEGWTKTVDESGITLERLDEGPWALGMAVRECIQLLRALGNSDPDDPPNEQSEQGYPLRYSLNGTQYESFNAMNEAFEASAPADYQVGSFELSQPRLLATDPGYHLDSGAKGVLSGRLGRWNAVVRLGPAYWRTYTLALQVQHVDHPSQQVRDWRDLEKLQEHAGIDTGQCGFFDMARVPLVELRVFNDELQEAFYRNCCEITQDRKGPGCAVVQAGGHEIGVVCDTGGDGGANIYVERDADGRVVLAQLVFLGDGEACETDS